MKFDTANLYWHAIPGSFAYQAFVDAVTKRWEVVEQWEALKNALVARFNLPGYVEAFGFEQANGIVGEEPLVEFKIYGDRALMKAVETSNPGQWKKVTKGYDSYPHCIGTLMKSEIAKALPGMSVGVKTRIPDIIGEIEKAWMTLTGNGRTLVMLRQSPGYFIQGTPEDIRGVVFNIGDTGAYGSNYSTEAWGKAFLEMGATLIPFTEAMEMYAVQEKEFPDGL